MNLHVFLIDFMCQILEMLQSDGGLLYTRVSQEVIFCYKNVQNHGQENLYSCMIVINKS